MNLDEKRELAGWRKFLVCGVAVAVTIFYGDALRRVFWHHVPIKSDTQPEPETARVIDTQGNVITTGSLPAREASHNFANGPELKHVLGTDTYEFVDGTGKLAMSSSFKRARPFSEGLAAVSDVAWHQLGQDERTGLSFGSSPWRFIDVSGKTAFPGRFARVSEFHNGRAIVTTLDRPWNPVCIDTTGKVVFDNPMFTEIYPFSKDGYAIVSMNWPPVPLGLVDRSGKLVISDVHISGYSEGLASFRNRKTGRFGFMDPTGKVVVKPKYIRAGDFSEGWAAVALFDTADTVYEYSTCSRPVYGYINKNGDLLNIKLNDPKLRIRGAGDFRNGRAVIQVWPDTYWPRQNTLGQG